MKLIIQRVVSASVKVAVSKKTAGSISHGLFVLVGVKKGDTNQNADALIKKLLKLRVMPDDNGKMNLSIVDKGQQILVVSQFTLYANTKDGNRPSFVDAADTKNALGIYKYFVRKLKKSGLVVEEGVFGSHMLISAKLDGPVTIELSN